MVVSRALACPFSPPKDAPLHPANPAQPGLEPPHTDLGGRELAAWSLWGSFAVAPGPLALCLAAWRGPACCLVPGSSSPLFCHCGSVRRADFFGHIHHFFPITHPASERRERVAVSHGICDLR